MIDGESARLLGRHVADRPHHHPGRRVRHRRTVTGGGGNASREAEVEDFHVAGARDEDVAGLQVAMDDAAIVRGGKGPGDLHAVLERLADRHRTARDDRRERLAVEQLGDGVRGRAVLADVVDRDDVRVGERGEGFHLALEPREGVGIGGEDAREGP